MISLHEIVRQYPPELQRPEFYDQMVKEYFHHYMLQSLFTGKHSGKIAFLGGTALRYLYNIPRFSENLDFDCFKLTRNEFMEMTGKVEKDLQDMGYEVSIEDRARYLELSAFRRVYYFQELKYRLGISQHKESRFFIKIEAEPHHYDYKPEIKTLVRFGIVTPVLATPPGILLSTKIGAAIQRKKDRDFYDVASLLAFIKPDFGYLEQKYRISSPAALKDALLEAAAAKNLAERSIYDCTHMLFHPTELNKIKSFVDYIKAFDFRRFE